MNEKIMKKLEEVALEAYSREMDPAITINKELYENTAERASEILLQYLEFEDNKKQKKIDNIIDICKTVGTTTVYATLVLLCATAERSGRFLSPETSTLIRTAFKLFK